MLLANFNRKEHVRHRAVSLRQHGFLVLNEFFRDFVHWMHMRPAGGRLGRFLADLVRLRTRYKLGETNDKLSSNSGHCCCRCETQYSLLPASAERASLCECRRWKICRISIIYSRIKATAVRVNIGNKFSCASALLSRVDISSFVRCKNRYQRYDTIR